MSDHQSDKDIPQPSKRSRGLPWWFWAVVFALFLGGLYYMMSRNNDQPTSRPEPASVQTAARRGEDLAQISQLYNQPTVVMAMFNNGSLIDQYPVTCDSVRHEQYPRGHFCNDRLNLRQANTLVPGQSLRVLATDGMPQGIEQTVQAVGRRSVSVLVDGADRKNLQHAAAIAYALQKRGQLVSIWVYTPTRMFEFIDQGRAFSLDRQNPGAEGAVTMLSAMSTQAIVLVSNTAVDFKPRSGAKPIIGYCLTVETCERPMRRLASQTGGVYIPFV